MKSNDTGAVKVTNPNLKRYNAALLGQGGNFTVYGIYPTRSLISPGGSLTGIFYDGKISISARYNGELGNGYQEHNANLYISYRF